MNIFVVLLIAFFSSDLYADRGKRDELKPKLSPPHTLCNSLLETQMIADSAVQTELVGLNNGPLLMEHGRYRIEHFEDRRWNNSRFGIYDIVTKNTLYVDAPVGTQIHISPDGSRLLEIAEHGSIGSFLHGYDSSVVEIPSWSRRDPLDLRKVFGSPLISGYVVAYSPNFDRLIVDRSHQALQPKANPYSRPWLAPNLLIVDVMKSQLVIKPLPGWKAILKWLKEQAALGTSAPPFGLSGELTSNGNHLVIKLTLETSTISSSVNQAYGINRVEGDWLGIWDLRSSKQPMITTSAELDSDLNRQFASRLLSDGTLLVASAVVNEVAGSLCKMTVKIATFRIGEKSNFAYCHQTSVQGNRITGFEFSDSGRKLNLSLNATAKTSIDLVKAGIIKPQTKQLEIDQAF